MKRTEGVAMRQLTIGDTPGDLVVTGMMTVRGGRRVMVNCKACGRDTEMRQSDALKHGHCGCMAKRPAPTGVITSPQSPRLLRRQEAIAGLERYLQTVEGEAEALRRIIENMKSWKE